MIRWTWFYACWENNSPTRSPQTGCLFLATWVKTQEGDNGPIKGTGQKKRPWGLGAPPVVLPLLSTESKASVPIYCIFNRAYLDFDALENDLFEIRTWPGGEQ